MTNKACVHLYCGDGKGKTTAAVGLAVRFAGRGGKVVLAQFLKDGTSGECRALAGLKNVTMLAANPCGKFSFQMSGEEKADGGRDTAHLRRRDRLRGARGRGAAHPRRGVRGNLLRFSGRTGRAGLSGQPSGYA